MKRLAMYIGVMLIGASIALSGCGAEKAAAPKAPLVKSMVIGETESGVKNTFSGTVHGFFESPLAFQVGGRIMQRYVTSGERVSAGQALFKVDSKDAEEQAAAARSQLNAAEASYRLAQSTLARYEKLHSVSAISDLAIDQTRNQAELAAAQLESAQAALSRAENNLGFTVLSADRDGIVGATLYEVGQVVAAGTPVVSIIDDSQLDVYISLTEKQYREYSVGMPCTVTFWALPNVSVEGRVREVAAAPNAQTGTYDAKVTLVDPPENIAVGMTAEVKFGDREDCKGIMIPLSAMATQDQKPSVWVIRDNKVTLTPIKVGRYGEDTVEIIEGLAKGDRIVTAGVSKLAEGEEVRV